MKKLFLLPAFLIISFCVLNAQYSKDFKRKFSDAGYLMWNENYYGAMEIYKELLEEVPENYNINYLIGMCYLNLPGYNDQAMEHFKKAQYSITEDYSEGSFREENSPPETLYGLARCHHINHQFEDAIMYYLEYRNRMIDPDFADLEYVNKQIEACERAKVMITEPRGMEMVDVGPSMPYSGNVYRPIFCNNDSTLFYMSDEPARHTILITHLGAGGWSDPEPLNEQIGSAGDCFINSVSADGKEMYISRTDNFNSDIYVCYCEQGTWSGMQRLNKHINTIYYESHASVSPDGKRLYFTSNRKGGQGALDIYVSEKEEDGDWGKAVNIGPLINTPYNEESPVMSDDNQTLYFSSQGHNTMGGFDVFYTILRSDGTWTLPENLGYPVNSGGDEVNYTPMDSDDNMFVAARLNDNNQLVVQQMRFLSDEEMLLLANREKEEMKEEQEEQEDKPDVKVPPDALAPGEQHIAMTTPSNKTLVINHIMFGYDRSDLSEEAKAEVDRLYMIMDEYPDLTVELVGHADSKGSDTYNLQLTRKRSESVGQYLIGKGIDKERLVMTGVGETEFIAINENADGSDNPEGRRLNRYVEIRLSDYEGVNITVEDIFVPDALKAGKGMEFTALVEKEEVTGSGIPPSERVYTIQIIALKNPRETSYFNNIGKVTRYTCKDGVYRYVIGEYQGIQTAMEALPKIKELGYKDAFIMNINHYKKISIK